MCKYRNSMVNFIHAANMCLGFSITFLLKIGYKRKMNHDRMKVVYNGTEREREITID
jgi:hypothetical protein